MFTATDHTTGSDIKWLGAWGRKEPREPREPREPEEPEEPENYRELHAYNYPD